MAKKYSAKFELVREDDYVEYYVYPQSLTEFADDTHNIQPADGWLRAQLEELKAKCLEIIGTLIQERHYIWHKDTFQLQVRTGSVEESLLLNDEKNTYTNGEATFGSSQDNALAAKTPPHLHGITHYGDNIADEWFIVFLLREITKHFPDVVVRIVDADGEFLLIEAADFLPKWANPNTCEQRVYLANGCVHLIENSSNKLIKVLPIATALKKLRANPTQYRVSEEIEKCLEERLKEFQTTENQSLHYQIVRVPVGVARLLKARPDFIAPAVRAFCDRDPIDMKACRSMLYFPPEERVRINVCFTRCLYAMLMNNNYMPERKIGWNLNVRESNTQEFKEDLLGIKLACGFEILASQAKKFDNNENEGESNVENSREWQMYINSLEANGYFRNEMTGSQEYQRLLKQAKLYFNEKQLSFRTMPVVGTEILQLLKTLDINAEALRAEENHLKLSDNDDWLNISAEELDNMLIKRYGVKKLYKANDDVNADEFTKNITEFLEKQSSMDVVAEDSNLSSHDDNDDDNSSSSSMDNKNRTAKKVGKKFTREQKSKMKKSMSMRRACKKNSFLDNTLPEESFSEQMRSFLNFTVPEDKWDSNSDSDMNDYCDDDDIEENFSTMNNAKNDKRIDKDIKAYMDEMDKELASTTIGQSFSGMQHDKKQQSKYNNNEDSDDFDDIEDFEPIDINVNTLKNLMDSYKNQFGGPGPVTQLLNAMGAGMSTATYVDENNDHDKKKSDKDLSESTV